MGRGSLQGKEGTAAGRGSLQGKAGKSFQMKKSVEKQKGASQ